MRVALQLFALVAILMMPFGMGEAAAAPVRHASAASMPMSHCGDQQAPKAHHNGITECTMACAAALPAGDAPRSKRLLIVCEPEPLMTVDRLKSLHPDTATPPPKNS